VGLCEFALDDAAIGDADRVVSGRQHAHEMDEALPAYPFEALKLGKRIGVIVDSQAKIGPFLLAAYDEGGGLLAAFLAASPARIAAIRRRGKDNAAFFA